MVLEEIADTCDERVNHNESLPWYKKISVEPSMFLYMFAFMLTSVVEQDFYVRKSCLVNHNFTLEICKNLQNYPDYQKKVQITTSNFYQWQNIVGHLFPIVLAFFLGAWSDKRGRKFPLLMGLTGKFIFSFMMVVNALHDTWPVEYIIYTAIIPSALTGADVAIFASCFAYISDISTVKDRTMRVTILDACYLSAMPIGIALGSLLFRKLLNESYAAMFAINSYLLAMAIIYSFFALKWQTTSRQRSLRELGACGIFGDFFDMQHVIDSLNILIKRRELHRRLFLSILLIGMGLYTFQRDEKPFLYLYTQIKFGWDVRIFSNFKTFQSVAYVLAMLTAVPLMSNILKWRDTIIIMIGAMAHAIARIFYFFAETEVVFYVGSAICSFGPIVGPLLRSMTSKIVPQSERGKVFALLSVCDNAVPFISGICYTQVYNATVGEMGGIFILTFATQIAVFLLMMIIHVVLGNRTLAVNEEKQPTLTDDQLPNSSQSDDS